MSEKFKTNYLLKVDCDDVRKRHRAFWQHKLSDFPLLYIKANKEKYDPAISLDKNKSHKDYELDLNWHVNHCCNQVLKYDFLFDSMPMAGVMFGRDITNMGVLCGEDFDIHPVSEFITFKNNPNFIFKPTPEFKKELPFVQKVLEIYQGIAKNLGQLACINPPTTADAITTMSMVMGTDQFMRSLYKHPGAIKKKAMELNCLFYSFYNFIYQYLLDCGYGESASWFPVFAEGKFDSIRSDVSVMLSNKMFDEFVLPTVENACSYMEYSMFNLDSVNLIRFIESLSSIKKLKGIYWNIEPWLNNITEYLPNLKRIKELGLLLALPCKDVSDAKLVIKTLGKDGLLLELPTFDNSGTAIASGEEILEFASHCLY